ncbi:MAG: hypothetical protein Q8M08_05945 [Bacteroidales bacterium]|nr:hypothetical protein [Bacteroidales bacterium]
MKIRFIFYTLLLAGIVGISGCGGENKDLKKDAQAIAEAMCKNMEVMKNLRVADPEDSILVHNLQAEYKNVESEMTALYATFREKYKEKINSGEFNDEFRKLLNAAMLDCKGLSDEDREAFEKGTK